jgi:hypothetical protein
MEPEPGRPLPGPIAMFLMGAPGPDSERASKAILDLRPGALIVVAPG